MKLYEEYIMIRELGLVNALSSTDTMIVETLDGTKRINALDIAMTVNNKCFYPTLNAMKADRDIKEGTIVQTIGYNSPMDGGGSTFYIMADDSTTNNATIVALSNQNLRAFLVDQNVRPEQFGAVGDGINNDTTAIQTAINTKRNVIFDSAATYKASRLVIPDGSDLNFNGCTLKECNIVCGSDSHISNVRFSNADVDSMYCITLNGCNNVIFDNTFIDGVSRYAIYFQYHNNNIIFNNTIINGTRGIQVYQNRTSSTESMEGVIFNNITFKRSAGILNVLNNSFGNFIFNDVSIINCEPVTSCLIDIQGDLSKYVFNNITAKGTNAALFQLNSSKAELSVSNIFTQNIKYVYNVIYGTLYVGGNQSYLSDRTGDYIINNMNGTMYINSMVHHTCGYSYGGLNGIIRSVDPITYTN